MPYKDKIKQRAAQLRYLSQRRFDWLLENGPCKQCKSWKNLQVDHIDPKTKITHNVWSRSQKFRDSELKKCQVLCRECHKKKTIKELSKAIVHGTSCGYTHYNCRCKECRSAHAKSIAEWRKKTGRR